MKLHYVNKLTLFKEIHLLFLIKSILELTLLMYDTLFFHTPEYLVYHIIFISIIGRELRILTGFLKLSEVACFIPLIIY